MGVEVVQPHTGQIVVISAPVEGFRFEWHPKIKNVYLINMQSVPPMGEPIAFEIENHGAAYNAVLIYLRGYRRAQLEKVTHGPKIIYFDSSSPVSRVASA